ncbi:hypothetical protein HLB23_21810 [Nocardia uniformis]|uniref:Uncharacterized protein n=1 Tax=Nocardia uniformis TaxID=53432 RepID=A0A849C159_9NOCA|nr:hypothetical protein [Nocardia uniformis]NNH72462.1 hypothetical protein [Nocardia uniformis]
MGVDPTQMKIAWPEDREYAVVTGGNVGFLELGRPNLDVAEIAETHCVPPHRQACGVEFGRRCGLVKASQLGKVSAPRYDRASAEPGLRRIGGVVEGSGEAYETLIVQVSELFPDVAAQIKADVAAGLDIPAEDQRSFVYMKANARSTEITTRKFSDDEKLEILLTALVTATRTAIESRERIAGFFGADADRAGQGYRITFASPDTGENLLTVSADQMPPIGEMARALEDLEQALALLGSR